MLLRPASSGSSHPQNSEPGSVVCNHRLWSEPVSGSLLDLDLRLCGTPFDKGSMHLWPVVTHPRIDPHSLHWARARSVARV